jgi:hypothetical protein
VKIRPEAVEPSKCTSQIWALIEKKVVEHAEKHWGDRRSLCETVDKTDFRNRSLVTYKRMHPDLVIDGAIKEKANLWTSERDAFLTSSIQKIDTFLQLQNAETCWSITKGNPILRHVDPEIIRNRVLETRMLCMDEVILETVAVRCWNFMMKATSMTQAQRTIEEHLAHYGPIQETIAMRISVAVIKGLKADMKKDNKTTLWNRLLKTFEALGCGISKLDSRVFQAWWDSEIEGHDHADLEVELDGSYTWKGIPIKEKLLMDWAAEKIIALELRRAPEALRRFRVYLDPPTETVQRVGRILFENSETPREFVELWVKMIKDNVMESPWLLAQLAESLHDERDLRTEFRRRAGRYMQLNVAAQKIPVDRFGGYCGTLQKLGFDFKMDTKRVLDKKFEEEPDIGACVRALESLQESRVFSLQDYKGWYFKVGSRFKPEEIDAAMKEIPARPPPRPGERRIRVLDKRRLVGLVKALKEGDPGWKEKANEWLQETKEAYHESFGLLEKKWIEWRLKRRRSAPRETGTIEFLCNDPGGEKWKLFGKRCIAPSRPEILWAEIQSWLKDCNRDELEYWRIWDEDGPVDPGGWKHPRDGERFVILLQPKSGTEDIETKMNPRDPESSVQRFIKRTRRRRKKSEFDVGIQDDFTFIEDGGATIDDTEREILRAIETGGIAGDRRDCGQGANGVGTIGSTGTEGSREDAEIGAKIEEHAALVKAERVLEHRPSSDVDEAFGKAVGNRRVLVSVGG